MKIIEPALLLAIVADDYAKFERLLTHVHEHIGKLNFNPNYQSARGTTMLMQAAKTPSPAFMEKIVGIPSLVEGIDPNLQDENGRTALHHAMLTSEKHVEAILHHFHCLKPEVLAFEEEFESADGSVKEVLYEDFRVPLNSEVFKGHWKREDQNEINTEALIEAIEQEEEEIDWEVFNRLTSDAHLVKPPALHHSGRYAVSDPLESAIAKGSTRAVKSLIRSGFTQVTPHHIKMVFKAEEIPKEVLAALLESPDFPLDLTAHFFPELIATGNEEKLLVLLQHPLVKVSQLAGDINSKNISPTSVSMLIASGNGFAYTRDWKNLGHETDKNACRKQVLPWVRGKMHAELPDRSLLHVGVLKFIAKMGAGIMLPEERVRKDPCSKTECEGGPTVTSLGKVIELIMQGDTEKALPSISRYIKIKSKGTNPGDLWSETSKTGSGHTLLTAAAASGNTDIFKFVLNELPWQQDKSLSIVDANGKAPIHYAQDADNKKLIWYLLAEDNWDKIKIPADLKHENSPLFILSHPGSATSKWDNSFLDFFENGIIDLDYLGLATVLHVMENK